ncbi:hypothetical protein C9I50_14820 [Pseudomonas prosekii]|nr:hypothetical protein C9I50_14820 [Pseudomonas prosekii]
MYRRHREQARLPQVICCWDSEAWHKSLVGVSLLAMAVYQRAMMLNVPPSSRASSAPTGEV